MQIITKTRTKTKTEIGQMLQKDSCRGNVETIKPFEDKDKKKIELSTLPLKCIYICVYFTAALTCYDTYFMIIKDDLLSYTYLYIFCSVQ